MSILNTEKAEQAACVLYSKDFAACRGDAGHDAPSEQALASGTSCGWRQQKFELRGHFCLTDFQSRHKA